MTRAAFCFPAFCLLILFMTIAAQASQMVAKTKPRPSSMRILIVRNASASCEPDCAEWISAEGDITSATPALLRRVLKAAGGRKLPFVISSPGGDVTASFAMGRLIRQAGLDVTVGRTRLLPCRAVDRKCSDTLVKGRYGWTDGISSYCYSACVFVLAGGVARHADARGRIGVHQFASTRTVTRWRDTTRNGRLIRRQILSVRQISVKTSPEAYGRAARYFKEMGIDPSINVFIQRASNDDIFQMNRDQLGMTKIITDGTDVKTPFEKLQLASGMSSNLASRVTYFTSTSADIPAGLYDGKAIISHVELRPALSGVGVEVNITPRIGSGAVPVDELMTAFRIGELATPASEPDGAGSSRPALAITLDPLIFCSLKASHSLAFTIGPRGTAPVTPETVAVSTGRFRDLDLLIYKICDGQILGAGVTSGPETIRRFLEPARRRKKSGLEVRTPRKAA